MFAPIYRFLRNKWWFDELYDTVLIRPTLFCGRCAAQFDQRGIDWMINGLASCTRTFTTGFDRWIDKIFIDGFVNWLAARTYAIGIWLRKPPTGRLRQYVVFIVVGTMAMYIVATFGLTN